MRRAALSAAALAAILVAGTILAASFSHWDDEMVTDNQWTTLDGSVYGYCMLKCVHADRVAHGVLYRDVDSVPGMSPGDDILKVRTFVVTGPPKFPRPVLGAHKNARAQDRLHLDTR